MTKLSGILNSAGGDISVPWSDLIAHDKPVRGDAPIKLRVARDNIAAALPGLTSGLGHLPDPLPLADASRRTWGVWSHEELVGALTVSVQNGWGTLAGQFTPGLDAELADQALHAVDERLLADEQVLALTVDGSRIRQYRG